MLFLFLFLILLLLRLVLFDSFFRRRLSARFSLPSASTTPPLWLGQDSRRQHRRPYPTFEFAASLRERSRSFLLTSLLGLPRIYCYTAVSLLRAESLYPFTRERSLRFCTPRRRRSVFARVYRPAALSANLLLSLALSRRLFNLTLSLGVHYIHRIPRCPTTRRGPSVAALTVRGVPTESRSLAGRDPLGSRRRRTPLTNAVLPTQPRRPLGALDCLWLLLRAKGVGIRRYAPPPAIELS